MIRTPQILGILEVDAKHKEITESLGEFSNLSASHALSPYLSIAATS